jgi:hypothetical protein
MELVPSQSEQPATRRAFTMAEVLVAVALVFLLTGIVLLSGLAMRSAGNLATTRQQLALISQGIDQYASFWPRWKIGGVVVAEEGWPDFIPGRLFATNTFESVGGFNDHLGYDLEGGIFHFGPQNDNLDVVGVGEVMHGNMCLAYGLTSSSGKGPQLTENDTAVLKDVEDPVLMEGYRRLGQVVGQPLLPAYLGMSGSRRTQVLVDAWGTPYRYFWVYRDTTGGPPQRAHTGYLPVVTADMSDDDFRTAEGYVLESAGPDRKFGNVWKANPTGLEIENASDNLTLMP